MKVRFAPSPTGALHIGGARTALYNWLAARGSGGTMCLRIEDTDRERSTDENVEQILDALAWLELDYDEGPISQAGRAERHAECLQRLIDEGKAYPDTATGEEVKAWKEANGGRAYRGEASPADVAEGAAIRLRIPDEGSTVVTDLIRGEISFDNALQDDLVIARSDGTVLYNFAVAVDDADLGITHVVRGDDHLSNTPKQLLVMAALGVEPPTFAHLPLLHGPDGKKLSKRHGAASVQELRDQGYLPAALRNYLALLGWGTDDDTTLMSTDELIDRFDLGRVGRSAAVFDEQKLRWINGRFMREQPLDEYEARFTRHLEINDPDAHAAFTAADPEARRFACEIVQEKAQTLLEIWPLIVFLFTDPEMDEKAWKKVMKPSVAEPLAKGRDALAATDDWGIEPLEETLRELMEREEISARKLLQPIRVAISGSSISPGIFESLSALGPERTLARLDDALGRFEAASETA